MTCPWADFIRPSAVPQLAICAGAAQMQHRAVAAHPWLLEWSSPAARQGTIGHAVAAQALDMMWHGPGMDEGEALAHLAGALDALEAWTREAVRRCISYAVRLAADLSARHGGRPVTAVIERHLSGQGLGIARGGTADLILICEDEVVVPDWKLGFLDQGEASAHLQLHTYAWMAWQKYEPQTLTVHLAQGRRGNFTAARFDADSIAAAGHQVRDIVDRASRDDAPLCAHIDACRYCKALVWCREARRKIMQACEEHALFGSDYADRAQLDADARLARRFAEAVKEQQRSWQKEIAETKTAEPK